MTDDTEERWLPLPEAPTYSVSNKGHIMGPHGRILSEDTGRVSIFYLGEKFRVNVKSATRKAFPDAEAEALNEPGEIWKEIPEHPGFELSNHARVRRGARTAEHGKPGMTRFLNARILKTSRTDNGYLVAYVGIKGSRDTHVLYIEKALFRLFPELMPKISSLDGEEWRDVLGYEGLYQISNLGRVLSLDRTIDDGHGRSRYIRTRVREPNFSTSGYPKVELAKDGVTATFMIHRLVALAFVPNPSGFDCVHHRDEDKNNPKATNLEWTTRGDNVRDWFDNRPHRVDAALVGRIAQASASGLTPDEILAALAKGG